MYNPFNYKKPLEHPITLYRLGKMSLPFGISFVRIVLFCIILVIMLFLHDLVSLLILFPNMEVIVYAGIPFLLSGALLKFKKDGKKVHRYLIDLTNYFFSIYFPKKTYCNDQEVLYRKEKITFEPLVMNQGGHRHEAENTDEANLSEYDAYRRRRHLGVLPDSAGGHSSVQ